MSMDQDCCLDAINNGGSTARELLDDLMPDAARRFNAVDRYIRMFLADVRRHFPNAQYYTASGGFNLMLGNPHAEGIRTNPQPELMALSGQASIGDGDF